jgi:hypothetical protein
MDDKFLASAVAKMKTEALSAAAAAAPSPSASASAAAKGQVSGAVATSSAAGMSYVLSFMFFCVRNTAFAAASSWDVNVEAAIPLEDAAHAAEDQVKLFPQLFLR